MFDRTSLKHFYFTALHWASVDKRLLRRICAEDHLVVLNLHQVSPHSNPFWPPLSPGLFDDLLGFLKRHFEITLFGRLAEERKKTADGTVTRRPRVILSFDDGYANFLEYALPLLEKHGCAANQNIIPSCVESGQAPWNIQLYDFLNSAPLSLINEIRWPGFTHHLRDAHFDSQMRFGLHLSRFLKQRPRHERDELWTHLAVLMAKADSYPRTRMLTADEVRALALHHEIGVHSFSHESMKYESDEFFTADLQACRAYFAERLHLPMTIYAFPNGSYRAEQIESLQQAGIEHVLLVDECFASAQQRVYPRFTIYGGTAVETHFQALGYNERK